MREIKEELGCQISIKRHLLTTEHHYDFGIVKMDAFLCHLVGEHPKCLEHNKISWLDANELPMPDWAAADLPVVEFLVI